MHEKNSAGDQSLSAVGIIAEYNPFHNGHAYQIRKAKELSGAGYCVVAMSGDFVQRGAPAIFDKYTRTRMALLSGADLVLELPPVFAASSAEDFAACGVALLDRLGVVSHLCFGSECGDTAILEELAHILAQEPEEFSRLMKEYLKTGAAYPQARARALKDYLEHAENLDDILSSPNNILGIEYCKAIQKRESSMTPLTIKRVGKGYHDTDLGLNFSSATAIRRAIQDSLPAGQAKGRTDCCAAVQAAGLTEPWEFQIPAEIRDLAWESIPMFPENFSLLLSYRLLELERQQIPLTRFADVSPELASRMNSQMLDFASLEDRIRALKTRQYTYTRISRCLLHILLHMTEEDIGGRKSHDYLSCIRVLGFRRDASDLLGAIKKASDLPLITKTADAFHILDPGSYEEFQNDLFCSHVYQSAAEQKSGIRMKNEYTQSVILV